MKKTIYIFLFTSVISLLQTSCDSEKKQEETQITTEIPKECMCNDVYLDAEYNHFYTTDRTIPYTGNCKTYNSDGILILEKNFKDGKLEGSYFEYYNNGILKSEWNFRQNRQHGDVKGFFEDGDLKYHSVYYKGDLDSIVFPKNTQ